jgi:outer membrane immunogenic protein
VKKSLITLVVMTTALSTPVNAADVDVEAYDWSGIYAGIYVGYGDSSGDGVDFFDLNFGNPADPARADLNGDGVIFGGLLGANRQLDSGLVLGVEVDLGISPSAKGLVGDSFGFFDNSFAEIDPKLSGSARARMGYAMDRFMPFVTGGVAYMAFDSDNRGNFDCDPFGCAGNGAFNGSSNFVGWTLGAGVNYAVSQNVIIGAEYRYSDFGSSDVALVGPPGSFETRSVRLDLQQHDIRASLSFKF